MESYPWTMISWLVYFYGQKKKIIDCFQHEQKTINIELYWWSNINIKPYLSPTAEHLIRASKPRWTVSVRNLVSKCAATKIDQIYKTKEKKEKRGFWIMICSLHVILLKAIIIVAFLFFFFLLGTNQLTKTEVD